MLGKLLKYEFKATGRTLLPLYGAALAFSILGRIFSALSNKYFEDNALVVIIKMLMLVGFVILIVAASIGTVIIIIQRFYKNLLKDEGYLMNTLPVPVSLNIWSKLIAAVTWIIICTLVIVISISVLFSGSDIIGLIKDGYSALSFGLQKSGIYVYFNFTVLILAGLVLFILGTAEGIMMLYTSMAIGHLSNNSKILCSFLAFIGLNIAQSIISGIVTAIMGITRFIVLNGVNDTRLIISYGFISSIFFTVVLFLLCNKILRDNLNLE